MAKHKASAASSGDGPQGSSTDRRSGQGAGSAMHEMLRRQLRDPRPTPPSGSHHEAAQRSPPKPGE